MARNLSLKCNYTTLDEHIIVNEGRVLELIERRQDSGSQPFEIDAKFFQPLVLHSDIPSAEHHLAPQR